MIPTGALIRRRILTLLCIMCVIFCIIVGQLINLQVVISKDLQARAQTQWTGRSRVSARRGEITDRNGTALALSATAYAVSASPRQVKDPEAFARELAAVLEVDAQTVAQKVADRTKGGVTLKRQVPRETAQALLKRREELRAAGNTALDGLYLEEDQLRVYPMGAFLTQVLGLTTIDGVGQSGLEKQLDKYLRGKDGLIVSEVDGRGNELPYSVSEYTPPVNGGSVRLTIDAAIQGFAEKAMRECYEVNSAVAVQAVVMDVNTGEVLAMVTKPDYDPNSPPRDDVEALTAMMRIRPISDVYEPGSTFKILTSAAALETGVTTPTEGFYCSGSVTVEGSKIRCWGRPHGAESMAEAIQNSCNPVFVELGLRLGTARLYSYLRAFGLGSRTGIDLEGESAGILIPESSVKTVDLARIGFGQSVAVTPLQLICAVSAVANGG
ncbi:MAG: peptidoglycan D,D-transpeptidase FtsI family protein, partial [Candidatus Fimadaptatus sp.]